MASTPEIINDLRAQANYFRSNPNLIHSLRRAADRLEALAADNKALRDEIDASHQDFAPLPTKRQKITDERLT